MSSDRPTPETTVPWPDPNRLDPFNPVELTVAAERERCIKIVKRWLPDEDPYEHPCVQEIRGEI